MANGSAKKILYGVLDWGLGHATRSMPVIASLREQGHEVVLCGAGPGLALLQRRFPECRCRTLPATGIRYGKDGAQTLRRLCLQIPRILHAMQRDARLARQWVREEGADAVVSDGRYGFRSTAAAGFFISHQLALPLPPGWPRGKGITHLLTRLNRWALRNFTEVWVPDFAEEPSLSRVPWDIRRPGRVYATWGPCADSMPGTGVKPATKRRRRRRFPQRPSPFWRCAADQNPSAPYSKRHYGLGWSPARGRVFFCGACPDREKEDKKFPVAGALNVYDHAEPEEMFRWMEAADAVVARSGYTTVMELAVLGKEKAVLVPTPGQPEQESLARHLESLGVCRRLDQDAMAGDAEGIGPSGTRGFRLFSQSHRLPS